MTDGDKAALLSVEIGAEAKPRSFTPAEMITCDECLRANPPTRTNCFYCAASLPLAENHQETQLTPKAAESPTIAGDRCYIVALPNQTNVIAESSLAEIAALLHFQAVELESVISTGRAAPLASTDTSDQAKRLEDQLRALGVESIIITEEALKPDIDNRETHALEISDDSLAAVPFRGGENISARWDDLILVVTGRRLVNRVEVEERRRRGRHEPLDNRELFSDESVLDLYTRSNEVGWRISAGSFDFSCLGQAKAMTAFENFTTLIELLLARGKNIENDDLYGRLRPVLANVWPLEKRTRKGDWRRSGAGKYDVSTVTTTDNEAQFNHYSRLRLCLRLRELEGGR